MTIGSGTFSGDVLSRLGLVNVLGQAPDRYPKRAIAHLQGLRPEVVVLPDEPYPFSWTDGPEAFPGVPPALVSGRDLTWYGPSLVTARHTLTTRISQALGVAGTR